VIRDLRVGLPFQAQQGGVMVESEPEHGSFFTVWLPAAEPGI
jgi:signal transduction histidine kinase